MPTRAASFTIREVADLTHTSRVMIQRRVNRGEIPSYTVGRLRRIPAEAVDALMATTTPPQAADDELDAYIKRLVDAAPRLSERQRQRLATIIGGAK